jgi:hypothetical protein
MTRTRARLTRFAAVAVLAFAGTGCARLFGSYDVAPNGLASAEDRLRRTLSTGGAAAAYDRFGRTAPEDEVLRAMYQGLLAYHAGDYAGSAAVLDLAGYLADERVTKSVSRSALSLVTSDLILPYEPGRTERLMIPYYAALARTRLGDREGAAVEARRLSLLLQHYRDDDARVDAGLAAALHLFAAAAFEANGDWDDADVALRNAAALDSTLAFAAPARGSGTVLVVLEHGFVAHRVEQGLAVMLLPQEVHAIAHGSAELKGTAAALVAGRIIDYAAHYAYYDNGRYSRSMLHVPAPHRSPLPTTRTRTVCTPVAATPAASSDAPPGTGREGGDTARARLRTVSQKQECTQREEPIDELPYLLKVAWPVYRSDYRAPAGARLLASETSAAAVTADLSRGVTADFERERALIVARTIARGTAKLAVTKGAEQKIEEKNEVAGQIFGLLGNIGSVLLERADTRSWHLLPAGVSVARLDLPAGEHELTMELDGRTLSLGRVTVAAQQTTILPARSW